MATTAQVFVSCPIVETGHDPVCMCALQMVVETRRSSVPTWINHDDDLSSAPSSKSVITIGVPGIAYKLTLRPDILF